jgi:hypothetical protein
MIFVVLLFSASLNAQSSGNSPAVLVQPPTMRACPVPLSVDRIVIMTNGASSAAPRD